MDSDKNKPVVDSVGYEDHKESGGAENPVIFKIPVKTPVFENKLSHLNIFPSSGKGETGIVLSIQSDHDSSGDESKIKVPVFTNPDCVEEIVSNKTDSHNVNVNAESNHSHDTDSDAKLVGGHSAFILSQIDYHEPKSSRLALTPYNLEVLKSGSIIETVDLNLKSFYIFGRLKGCDIAMEHPSLSRYHAILQYCAKSDDSQDLGWYLFDLDSTHGTWLNKVKLKPKAYHRVRVGHVMKFGGSTRLYILQGPNTDREEESELGITELKKQREQQKREVELLRLSSVVDAERVVNTPDDGCSWGMDEDAEEEVETEENPFSLEATENEDLYIDDPKKALRGFFEREGYDMPEYEIDDESLGKHRCRVHLPLDTPSGGQMVAEVVHSGKKKEAVKACALEACRILDRHGLLRASTHESHKRKSKDWEEADYYDSDDDTYLDRTGAIEKKRRERLKRARKQDGSALKYDNLVEQHKVVTTEIEDIEAKLEKAKQDAAAMESDDVDALDAYMMAIKSGIMDTRTKIKLRGQLMELKKEEARLRKLVNVAKPATLPELKPRESQLSSSGGVATTVQKQLPIVGKRRALDPGKIATLSQSNPALVHVSSQSDKQTSRVQDHEEQESDDDEDAANSDTIIADNRTELDSSKTGNSDKGTRSVTNKGSPVSQTHNSNVVTNTSGVKIVTPKSDHRLEADTTVMGPSLPPPPPTSPKTDVAGPVLPSVQRVGSGKGLSEEMKVDSFKRPKSFDKKTKVQNSDINSRTQQKTSSQYDEADPDYAVWIPPDDQSGDGQTELNKKYGY